MESEFLHSVLSPSGDVIFSLAYWLQQHSSTRKTEIDTVKTCKEHVVKILDTVQGTLHTLTTPVSNTHWGVARGSDATVGQGLEPLTAL